MLKLTAFCPTDKTDAVVAALREQPGVKNVFRLPAADVEAGRDVVMAHMHSEAADAVLGRLRALRDWQAGDLSFINVDLVVRHDLAQVDAGGDDEDEADTIAWEVMQMRAREEARLSWRYLVFMVCAGLIAALGLVKNMPILVVGAMSLSPDLAPANAIAVNLAMGSVLRMLRALGTLVVGLGLAMAVAFVVTVALQAMGVLDSGVAAVSEQLTTYVTALAPATLAVAIVAGVAAMVAFVTEQGTTAVGVAISVTTIPAAAYAGVALASGEPEAAWAALVVLTVNVVCLVLAQVATLATLRRWKKRRDQRAAEQH